MSISLHQILEMPNAAILAKQIETALENERGERHRFYKIIDENTKMEFINGEIFFHSPVKIEHNSTTGNIYKLLDTFVEMNDLGYVGIEKILISLTRNDYEPDVVYFDELTATAFHKGQMKFPVPQFVAEVLSPSTEKNDRETKFLDYAAHGVSEYWVVDAENEIVEQYFLQNGEYSLILKSNNGEITSVILPNFKIPIRAIFDNKTNLQTLAELIAK